MKTNPMPDYQAKLPRFCLHCKRPLPTGEHALRKYCEKWYDQFGQVHDCKSDYHTLKNKPQNDEFRNYRNSIIADFETIKSLIAKFGDEVTTEQLDAHNLELCRSLEYVITNDGKVISKFHGFLITSDSFTNKHKIQPLCQTEN